MKKFLLLALLAVSSLCASAQYYVGGSLGVMRDYTDKETNFAIAPEMGYSYSDHWGVGLVLNYVYKNYHAAVSNGFSFNPYARLTYARVADDRLKFFVDGGFDFGFAKKTGQDTGVFYHIGFKPGLAYDFNDHWSIVTHLGFLGYMGATKAGEEYGYHRKLGFDFSSLNLNFGLSYVFD